MLSHESYYGLIFFLYCYRYVFAGIVSFLIPVCPFWCEGYFLSISSCSFLLAYRRAAGFTLRNEKKCLPGFQLEKLKSS